MFFDFLNKIYFLDVFIINFLFCLAFIANSVKNMKNVKNFTDGNLDKKKLGIFGKWYVYIKYKHLFMLNWVYIENTLKQMWNLRINILLFICFAQPILFYQINCDCIDKFIFSEMISILSLVFIIKQRKEFFGILENYLIDDKMDENHSNLDAKYLFSSMIDMHKSFINGIKVNQKLTEELGKLSDIIVHSQKISNSSKELLQNLTTYIIKK